MVRSHPLVGAAVLLGAAAAAQAAGVLVTPLTTSPHAWDVVEMRVDPDRQYANPFNPDEVAIDAVVTSPKGAQVRVPAFWYQRYATQAAEPGKPPKLLPGESFWMVRLCPTEPGEWSLQTEVKDATGTRKSEPAKLTVAAADAARGFVRVAPNHRYLAFDSGEPYFVVGINMAWGSWGLWADQFDAWFTKLTQSGGNFARIWTTEQRWRLEHPETGLGRYDLASGAFYDEVLAAARKRGVYVMLTFMNHRDLLEKDMWGAAPWPTSPYNASKGGPATRPADFFTDPKARKAFQNRLRYAVARYGACTNIAFWELFNEQEVAGLGPQVAWNQEMSAYIAGIDPYRHLITTSSQNLPAELWKLPTIACTQVHYYGDDTTVDLVTPVAEASRSMQGFGKPQLVAEFGISYKRSDSDFDAPGRATALHNSLWTAMMAGAAGGACHWWWDSYVDPKGLWPSYKPFAQFAKDVDWVGRDFRPVSGMAVEQSGASAETFGDAVLPCAIDWQKADGQTITLLPNGKTDRPLPRFLYSISKPELRAPYKLSVDLAKPSEMVLHVEGVFDFGTVRVSVDGKPVRDFAFSALPGDPDVQSTEQWNGGALYMATINKDRRVSIPAGKHTITLDNIAGDWVKLESITFTGVASSRYANMAAAGIQDAATSQTLLWVRDERSNWKSDKEGKTPTAQENVVVTIPVKQAGRYRVTWFDTWKGGEIAHESVTAAGTTMQLNAPAFVRDIAAKVSRE